MLLLDCVKGGDDETISRHQVLPRSYLGDDKIIITNKKSDYENYYYRSNRLFR